LTPLAHLRAAVGLVVISLNLGFWVVLALPLALAKLLWPGGRGAIERAMGGIYRAALWIDDLWLGRVVGIRWPRPALGLAKDRTYVVLSNHVSWSDIFVIQSIVVRDGPLLKFLAKRELLRVPIVGAIIWAFDFPVLRRQAKAGGDEAARRTRDLETLRAAADVLRDHPAAVMNFAEGTRSTEAKRVEQESPYAHLLIPRVGGFATLIEGLGEELEAVVDLTLVYPRPVSFWALLAGAVREIGVDAEVVPRARLPRGREDTIDWLLARWARKDAILAGAQSARD